MPPIASSSHFAKSSLATGFFLVALAAGTGDTMTAGDGRGIGFGLGMGVTGASTGVEGPEVGVL